jgi:hypothetical protein
MRADKALSGDESHVLAAALLRVAAQQHFEKAGRRQFTSTPEGGTIISKNCPGAQRDASTSHPEHALQLERRWIRVATGAQRRMLRHDRCSMGIGAM